MGFKTISFPESHTSYIVPSFAELDELTFQISQKILDKGIAVDRVVTLAKGGWPMTRSMVDYLQVDKVASIGVRFYSGINQRLERPEIYQDVPVSVSGERVLLFDDVADTGESMEYVVEYLQYKNVAEVVTASLFYKSRSSLTPDFVGAHTDAWIIFPFERREIAKTLLHQWFTSKISKKEAQKRLRQLLYPDDQIEYYVSTYFHT